MPAAAAAAFLTTPLPGGGGGGGGGSFSSAPLLRDVVALAAYEQPEASPLVRRAYVWMDGALCVKSGQCGCLAALTQSRSGLWGHKCEEGGS